MKMEMSCRKSAGYSMSLVCRWNELGMSYIGQRRAGGGGKTYHVNLGGGGNVLRSVLSKTTFGGLRNWGWSGRCLFPLREMRESCQKGGGDVSQVGGSKDVFGEGFYGMFPPPRVFHPLGRTLTMSKFPQAPFARAPFSECRISSSHARGRGIGNTKYLFLISGHSKPHILDVGHC